MKNVEEIKALSRELYDKCIDGLKDYIKEHGKKKNQFIETISYDIQDFEIVYDFNGSTIDEIYYVPSKDSLGFIIYDGRDRNKIYKSREFSAGQFYLVYTIFNLLSR